MVPFVAGCIGGVGILVLGYATRQGRFISFYSSLLIVIALVYVLFGAMTGSLQVVIAESLIAVGFTGAAIVGVWWPSGRAGAVLIAAGLIAHGLFDLAHDAMIENTAVPAWWPPFCGVVDGVVGLWLLWLVAQDRVISARPDRSPSSKR